MQLILALGLLGLAAVPASAQTAANPCPPVGADSGCGIILTVIDIGTGQNPCPSGQCVTVTNTGQPPYDNIEDTLVGVVNNSQVPISSMVLTSTLSAFGFDGDGICGNSPNTGQPYVPAPPCTWAAPTTYEGPVLDAKGNIIGVVSFSNYSSGTSGSVTFTPPIPAKGGMAYFSLEESLTNATTCTDIINNSVTHALVSGGKGITALFTSNTNLNYTLAQAAQACGFTDWDFQQQVTMDPCADVFEAGSTTPLKAPPPYNDPPLNGYSYQMPPNAVHIPVYWNPYTSAGTLTNPGAQLLSLADHKTTYTMNFGDGPSDPCLSGAANGSGKKLGFTTHLVGLVGAGPGYSVQDTGVGFSYITTFNGTSGGIAVRNSLVPPDPNSGTGGITITTVSNTTNYQYPKGIGVSQINGLTIPTSSNPPVLLGSQVAVTASGLAYSRVTQTFNATVTIKNVGATTINGPLQVVVDTLTPGVTVNNASGTFGGWSYVTVPGVSSLAPGQSATATILFKNPTNAVINFSPVVYSGSFT
ncbi:MAG TPA: hypothetical protein VGS58_21825 [Candidatus Sulfopaludibacter sp.]|nr:hypothetical protein [Candidatus Sulfopaludibacter sp.]